jgi:hypothetical protein
VLGDDVVTFGHGFLVLGHALVARIQRRLPLRDTSKTTKDREEAVGRGGGGGAQRGERETKGRRLVSCLPSIVPSHNHGSS